MRENKIDVEVFVDIVRTFMDYIYGKSDLSVNGSLEIVLDTLEEHKTARREDISLIIETIYSLGYYEGYHDMERRCE